MPTDEERLVIASDTLERRLLELLPEWIRLDDCTIAMVDNRQLEATVFCSSTIMRKKCTLTEDVFGLKRSELKHLADVIHRRIVEWYKI